MGVLHATPSFDLVNQARQKMESWICPIPRNAAARNLRQLDTAVVAKRDLATFPIKKQALLLVVVKGLKTS